MMDLALQIVALAASAVIVSRAEPALNRMSGNTVMMVRFAMFMLTAGAACQIGTIVLLGAVPTFATVLALIGVAALILCERRVRALTRFSNRPTRRDLAGDIQ